MDTTCIRTAFETDDFGQTSEAMPQMFEAFNHRHEEYDGATEDKYTRTKSESEEEEEAIEDEEELADFVVNGDEGDGDEEYDGDDDGEEAEEGEASSTEEDEAETSSSESENNEASPDLPALPPRARNASRTCSTAYKFGHGQDKPRTGRTYMDQSFDGGTAGLPD
jgi:hypothetical protein